MELREQGRKDFRQWPLMALAVVGLALRGYSQSADSFNPAPSYWVGPVAIQADGKIIFGGDFTSVSGQSRTRLARVSIDGVLDTAFNAVAGKIVYALAIQPDGKTLVGGDFTSLGGQTRRAIGRLNTNGTLDSPTGKSSWADFSHPWAASRVAVSEGLR